MQKTTASVGVLLKLRLVDRHTLFLDCPVNRIWYLIRSQTPNAYVFELEELWLGG